MSPLRSAPAPMEYIRSKIVPGQLRPDGRMVTFWLIDGPDRVEADQDILFRGQGETRVYWTSTLKTSPPQSRIMRPVLRPAAPLPT